MSVLNQMQDMLSPLGIYSLDDGSLVMCELTVYAAQLEAIHERISEMLRECFVSTAQSYGINRIEELFQRIRPDLTLEERKDRIHMYTTLDNNNFSPDSIRHQLRLVGATSAFIEDAVDEQLTFPELVSASDIVHVAEQLGLIEDIVPAHLHIEAGLREHSWDEFDALDFCFGTLDRMSLRFDAIEEE